MRNFLLIVLLIIVFGNIHLSAQVPNQISWQGVLTDSQGQALDGTYNLTTKLFNQSVGGDALWIELHNSKQIEDGQVNLILGSIENLNLQFNQPYWLEITVGAGTPLSRIQLTSVPYSLYSANSNPVIINDSLVLKDSLGVTRMVFNPNTGTFSMMDNDTVWYSMSVNSPVKITEKIANDNTFERYIDGPGLTVTRVVRPDGTIESESISETSSDGLTHEYLSKIYDSEGRLISSTFIFMYYDGVGFKLKEEINKTFDPESEEVISETSTNENVTKDELVSKTERLNGVIIRTIENADGKIETLTYNQVGAVQTHMISSNNENKTEIISGTQSTIVEQTPIGLFISNPESDYSCGFTMGAFGGSYPSPICSLSVSTPNGNWTPISINDQGGTSGCRIHINEFLTVNKTANFLANTSFSSNLTLFANLTMSSVSGTATLKNTTCSGLTVNGPTALNGAATCQGLTATQDITTSATVNCDDFDASGNGEFGGNVQIAGDLDVTGLKKFKIDHPDDPLNKSLSHVCIESNEALNQYSGNVVTDASGYAVVTLPDYVEKINIDFRFQLTVIGDFAQAIISKKIQNNQFEIRTDKANMEVSWLITAKRNDSYAKNNPFQAVSEKIGDDKGKLLYNPSKFSKLGE
ncbi:MAG: hypothetical protein CVV22_06790 [Ignavibacteriae bacterium HGW-Ignavibacteriae-1]|jgi:hypothetical protein|nr:MAG: hypothetical protein CVV22_06790 [Ignavibacteriae bacterium HGW-Ignavibacteriae-1]